MNILRKLIAAGAGAGFALMAMQASAGVVTINFTGNGGTQSGSSMVFTSGGVSVTVTAGANAVNNEYNITSRIAQYSDGLGNLSNYSYTSGTERYCKVQGRYSCQQYAWRDVVRTVTDNDHEVDNHRSNQHGVQEFLKLDFAGLDVTILNVDFGYHNNNDHATLRTDSAQLYAGGADPIKLTNNQVASSLYWILAGTSINSSDDDWKLKSITFSYADPVEEGPDPQDDPTDVPAPAALSILGLGLAGLGIARRRRR